MSGYAVQTFELLRHYHLFEHLFPSVESSLEIEEQGFPHTLLIHGLANTDQRIAENKPVTPAFLFAVLLWGPLCREIMQARVSGKQEYEAMQQAVRIITGEQVGNITVPRRFITRIREIWMMQPRLKNRSGKRPLRVVEHPSFRAAYDFMLLRNQSGEDIKELCDWWTEFQEADENARHSMLKSLRSSPKPLHTRRNKRRAKTKQNPATSTSSISE